MKYILLLILFPVFLKGQIGKYNVRDYRIDSVVGNNNELYYQVIYSDNNRLKQEIITKCIRSFEWEDEHGGTYCNSKYEYKYDENGKNVLTTYYWFYPEKNQYDLFSKTEKRYDENGNLILEFMFYSNSKYKYEFINTRDEKITFYYKWDNQSENFIPLSKYISSIDSKGNENFELTYTWDIDQKNFILKDKNEYEYDSVGNVIQSIHSEWDNLDERFVYTKKRTFKFDKQNNEINRIIYKWDADQKFFYVIKKRNIEFKNGILWSFKRYRLNTEKKLVLYRKGNTEKDSKEKEIFVNYVLDNVTQRFIPAGKYQRTNLIDSQNKLVFSIKTFDYDKNFNLWTLKDEYLEYLSKK